MTRYIGPKNRIARRFSANIFGRLRNPLIHKPNPPGMHGGKRKKKSDYGVQLEEKQKLKAIYGMLTDRQLVFIFHKAQKKKGNTAHLFLRYLECRLDNLVHRLRFAPTIFAAQQMVSHGHVLVNGKKVDIRSFVVEPGMVISLKEKVKKNTVVVASLENLSREIPEYLSLDKDKCEGTLMTYPESDQIPLPVLVNIPLVCEFLSHSH